MLFWDFDIGRKSFDAVADEDVAKCYIYGNKSVRGKQHSVLLLFRFITPSLTHIYHARSVSLP